MTYKELQQYEQGQTLIETMVAVFILAMGISAALGLAIFSLNATSSTKQQLIGIGLAREGIEAVKNIRDTNWLVTPLSSDCYDYFSGTNTANCYKEWINPTSGKGIDIGPVGSSGEYVLNMDTGKPEVWEFLPVGKDFGLNFDITSTGHGFYHTDGATSVEDATSDFARKIVITVEDSFDPFDRADLGPRLRVSSQVWWKNKKCPESGNLSTDPGCSVVLETYLTNWKNF